jgi:acetamidase/formamidase
MSAFDLTEDQALTLMTVACDFQIHQVVDGNWGTGLSVPKYVFEAAKAGSRKARYSPKTICGSSVPV